jgi:hypothetical protein
MQEAENMSNNLKPWFRDDLARAIVSIYFSSVVSGSGTSSSEDYRKGFAAALSSIAIVVGINPETILQHEDMQLLRDRSY